MAYLLSLIPWQYLCGVLYRFSAIPVGFGYQGDKERHFCSIHALVRLLNTLANSHTNPYNLRHCVTQIVTHKLQRDVQTLQMLTEIRLPMLAWHQVSLLGLQEWGSTGFLYTSRSIKWLSESPKPRKFETLENFSDRLLLFSVLLKLSVKIVNSWLYLHGALVTTHAVIK